MKGGASKIKHTPEMNPQSNMHTGGGTLPIKPAPEPPAVTRGIRDTHLSAGGTYKPPG